MSIWQVTGMRPLRGHVRVQGSKNAVLPVIAASLLCPGVTELTNCPELSDVEAGLDILRRLGCTAHRQGDILTLDTRTPHCWEIPAELTHRMRSSVIFLGPVLARFGEARVSLPGGCELGPRPIDLHLEALRRLGAEVREEEDGVFCRAAHLRGAEIPLKIPSVGATENAMIAACAAEGTTHIRNAAREPEIAALQEYLRRLGAEVSGAGTPNITVTGFTPRDRAGIRIPGDRIAAATYLCCTACAGGEVELTGVREEELRPVTEALHRMGCELELRPERIHMAARGRLSSAGRITTRPYPLFPTDAAPLLMAACLRAEGRTYFTETIFSSRYRHAEEMRRLGAEILLRGELAVVTGRETLRAGNLTSPDLRGGAALVAAALGAEGTSQIWDNGHIDRGYEALESCLTSLGAEIRRRDGGST